MITDSLSFPSAYIAFSYANSSLSSTAWHQRVAACRHSIAHRQQQGKLTQPVMLFAHDSADFSCWLFALAMQQVDVILPPNDQPETLQQLASQASAVAGDIDESLSLPVLSIAETKEHSALDRDIVWPSASRLIFFTSGSSGAAKPIIKYWWQLNREVANLADTFGLKTKPTSAILSTVSHQHVYGLLFKLLLPLYLGSTIYPQALYPEDVAGQLLDAGSAILIASPAFLTRLTQDNLLISHAATLHQIFSSGAPLPLATAQHLYQQLGRGVQQIYGSTETGGIAHRCITTQDCAWQTFEGIEVSLDDQRLRLSSVYIEETSRLLDDKAELTGNGCFMLKGRADRVAKIEDKRVDLDAMERFLLSHPAVAECRLLHRQDPRPQLAIAITLTDAATLPESAAHKRELVSLLKQHLLQQFELVCLPRKWRFVPALPYNSQGKLTATSMEALFV